MRFIRLRWPASVSLILLLFLLPGLVALAFERVAGGNRDSGAVHFFDAPSQAAEFIGYSRSIALTAEQQAVKNQVLGRIPAPCCRQYSVATCCCPCNLAKSVWGLSNFLIVKKRASAAELEKSVRGWLRFTNAKGYSGDACDTGGGCVRPFSANGCGGMDEKNLIAAR